MLTEGIKSKSAQIAIAWSFVNPAVELTFASPFPIAHALSHRTASKWAPLCMFLMVLRPLLGLGGNKCWF